MREMEIEPSTSGTDLVEKTNLLRVSSNRVLNGPSSCVAIQPLDVVCKSIIAIGTLFHR